MVFPSQSPPESLQICSRSPRPPLLVFPQCLQHGGTRRTVARELASSVAPALALRGIPAVVGMVNLVYDTDAITFARTVYAQLAPRCLARGSCSYRTDRGSARPV